MGYFDGHRMAAAFNLLRSNDLIWPYIINIYMKGRTQLPLDLLYWNSDSTPHSRRQSQLLSAALLHQQ